MPRLLAIATVVGATIFAATSHATEAFATACASPNAKPAGASRALVTRSMVCLINAERRKHGLRALRLDSRLSRAALDHSRDMVRRRYFSHTTPEGFSPAHRIRGTGYLSGSRRWLVGENMAWGWRGRDSAARVMRAWMHSPPHRKEILEPSFRDVGIGAVAGVPRPLPRGGATYTVDFGVTRPASSAAALRVDRFDAGRTWRIVERQLAYGQRPAGSPQLRRLASTLRRLLPNGRFEPLAGAPGLRNVVGTLPGRRPGIVVGAHYDTLVKPAGFVGANNGAAGSAVVIEAARALSRVRPPHGAREVRFVLFDGEEPEAGLPEESTNFYTAGLRGSRAYVARHPRRTAAMILLDYVGNRGLRLPREGSSTPALWDRLRASARSTGATRFFPDGTGATIVDDHTPFLRAGVPAVDLIDWSYPGHDISDRLDKLSRRSLDAVGETVVELVEGLRG